MISAWILHIYSLRLWKLRRYDGVCQFTISGFLYLSFNSTHRWDNFAIYEGSLYLEMKDMDMVLRVYNEWMNELYYKTKYNLDYNNKGEKKT